MIYKEGSHFLHTLSCGFMEVANSSVSRVSAENSC